MAGPPKARALRPARSSGKRVSIVALGGQRDLPDLAGHTKAVVALLILTSLVVLSACEEAPGEEGQGGEDRVSLPDAVDRRLVAIQINATGSASGDVITLRVQRMAHKDLFVTVPRGMILANANANEQDLVVRRLKGEDTGSGGYYAADVIGLEDEDEHTFILEAYCLEADKDNPSQGSSLAVGQIAGSDVMAVLDAFDENDESDSNIRAFQAAIWVVTDDVTLRELEEIDYGLSSDDLELVRHILETAGFDAQIFRMFRYR